MSLLDEFLVSGTFKRQIVTPTDGLGDSRTYTTAARGTLPTTGSFRLLQATIDERLAYGVEDQNATDYLLFTTNPRLDNRDQIHIAATETEEARVLNVLTQTNLRHHPTGLWIVVCQESDRSVK